VPTATPDDARRDGARHHFEQGIAHFDRQEWDAALVEFIASRDLFPTKGNTKNAAICLRKVSRFDEALDMVEALEREFPDLPPEDRQFVHDEMASLRASVGAIDVRDAPAGATLFIDGKERGALPRAQPLRISAGSHLVRVVRDGYLPFEGRVGVAGVETTVVHARLLQLTRAGRLRVAERTERSVDVVVDGTVVGRTPWEGALAPGEHVLLLRGEGSVGTQPMLVTITLDQVMALDLLAEDLGAMLAIEPQPAWAAVSLDGVALGRGAWQGRVRVGKHRIEATADAYLSARRELTLVPGPPRFLRLNLERDARAMPGAIGSVAAIEIDGGFALGFAFAGDVGSSCTGACSSSLPIGAHGLLRGEYRWPSGFSLGLDAGYLATFQNVRHRSTVVTPMNLSPNTGTADDRMRLGGLTIGASISYRFGGDWPVLFRLGAGAFVGDDDDRRTGTFMNSLGESYSVDMEQSPSAIFVYAAPEVRIGRRLTRHLQIDIGAEVLLMTAVRRPGWDGSAQSVLTAPSGTADHGDGFGSFASETLTNSFFAVVVPGLGLRYEL
jgi:hypothetical protein